MCDRLAHRGPDQAGILVRGSMAFGHRRLSIIDLDGGQQPIANEDGTVWIVFNGEIYNFKRLRADLEQKGHQFRTHTDTEAIVHLYEEYGTDCLSRLRGMFAFAIWDERKRVLFAARDRLGQKPFYYSTTHAHLAFASEIKALIAADPSRRELDLSALDEYFSLRLVAAPKSMFKRIRKLPPAHFLLFSPGQAPKVERYWDLAYGPKWTGSDEDLIDELERRITEAITSHLVSDVPVGAFLSGGLDSTLIVGLMARQGLAANLQTFTVGLPYEQFDEAPAARAVAETFGTRHREEQVRPSLLDSLPRLVEQLDEPSDPLAVCMDLVARLASSHVKVVLGGDGGDELFGGYDRYYGVQYAGRYAQIPAPIRNILIGPALRLLPDGKWYKSAGHQLKWLHRLAAHDGGERYVAALEYFYLTSQWRDELYGPVLRRAREAFDAGGVMRTAYESATGAETLDRMLYADLHARLPDHPVMIQDRMTMAHGLEARSPFMDHELVEFAARLPTRLKVRGRELRRAQVALARRHLPPNVLARKKQGFSSALPYLLKDELSRLYDCFLQGMSLAQDGLIVQGIVDRMLGEHRSGLADHGNRLWLLVNAEVWYRMFIHGKTRAELEEEIRTEQAMARS